MLLCFPEAGTDIATQLITRIQNIHQSPSSARYEVTYKLYRKQSERLATFHFANSSHLYCLCGNDFFELSPEFEHLLLKLKAWTLRQTIRITGSIHELQPMTLGSATINRISVGTIIQGPSSKGIVLEIRRNSKGVLQSGLDPEEEQTLAELLDPYRETLYHGTKSSFFVINSTASAQKFKVKNVSPDLQVQETITMAMCYFDLFSKI